jgi:glycosyltransferase involved in cell wall biosynthesis
MIQPDIAASGAPKRARPLIVQACRDLTLTGGGRVVIEVSRYLMSRGWNVEIYTDHYDPASIDFPVKVNTMPLGARLHAWRAGNKVTKTVRHTLHLLHCMFYGSWALARHTAGRDAIVVNHNAEYLQHECIVAHNVFNAELAQQIAQSRRKMLRYLNPVASLRIVRERVLFRRAAHILAVSRATAREASVYAGPRTAVHAIRNGVDAERFAPCSLEERVQRREALGYAPDDFVVIFVGHEFNRKGLDPLIDAMPMLPPRVKLLVVGGRTDNIDQYRNKCASLGVASRVRFAGTHRAVWELYQISDVFALPSAYEAFVLVGLEALATGVPALMTDTGGTTEYLSDDYNGYVVRRDAADIARRLNAIVADPALYARLRANARASALPFSWQHVGALYEQILLDMMDGNHTAPRAAAAGV